MESPELKRIQRTIVTNAKRNLYSSFLFVPKQNLTNWDLDLMNLLARDPDIQDILDAEFSRNKNR